MWILVDVGVYPSSVLPRRSCCNWASSVIGKYSRALRKPNKGRKYNSNRTKNRNNRTKKLALLGRCPSR